MKHALHVMQAPPIPTLGLHVCVWWQTDRQPRAICTTVLRVAMCIQVLVTAAMQHKTVQHSPQPPKPASNRNKAATSHINPASQ